LNSLISHVGSSSKIHDASTNGQFGFGIFSFLAVCDSMSISSRLDNSSVVNKLELNSKMFESDSSEEGKVIEEQENITRYQLGTNQNVCFTQVKLEKFDKHIFKELNPKKLKLEIEQHFELILSRKNLTISIQVKKDRVNSFDEVCSIFDYSKLDGEEYYKELDFLYQTKSKKLNTKSKIALTDRKVKIYLKVSKSKILDRKPVFFIKGRRITEISNVSSYRTNSKGQIWSHPNVTGYIDVTNVLEPIISRNDFKSTVESKALFSTLLELEPEIKKFIEDQLIVPRTNEYKNLGLVLSKMLKKIPSISKFHNLVNYIDGESKMLNEGKIDSFKKIRLVVPQRVPSDIPTQNINERLNFNFENSSDETGFYEPALQPKQRNNYKIELGEVYIKQKIQVDKNSSGLNSSGKSEEDDNKSFGINIVIDGDTNPPEDNQKKEVRSLMSGNDLIIYSKHPMFSERIKSGFSGVKTISKELIHYLALEIITQIEMQIYNSIKNNIPEMGQFIKEISELVHIYSNELLSIEGKDLKELSSMMV